MCINLISKTSMLSFIFVMIEALHIPVEHTSQQYYNDFQHEILENLRQYTNIKQNHIEYIRPSIEESSFTIQTNIPVIEFKTTNKKIEQKPDIMVLSTKPEEFKQTSQTGSKDYSSQLNSVSTNEQKTEKLEKGFNAVVSKPVLNKQFDNEYLPPTLTNILTPPPVMYSQDFNSKPFNIESFQNTAFETPKRTPAQFYGPPTPPQFNVPQFGYNHVRQYLPPNYYNNLMEQLVQHIANLQINILPKKDEESLQRSLANTTLNLETELNKEQRAENPNDLNTKYQNIGGETYKANELVFNEREHRNLQADQFSNNQINNNYSGIDTKYAANGGYIY